MTDEMVDGLAMTPAELILHDTIHLVHSIKDALVAGTIDTERWLDELRLIAANTEGDKRNDTMRHIEAAKAEVRVRRLFMANIDSIINKLEYS